MSSRTQTSAYNDKLDRLKTSQNRKTSPSQAARSEDSIKAHRNIDLLLAQEQLEESQIHNAQLEGANQHLRNRLQEALSELQQARYQIEIQSTSARSDFFQNLGSQGITSTPPSVTSGQKHATQEARDARVLSLLRSKDEALESLEARCAEATSEASSLRSQLTAVTRRLETNQIRLDELLEANTKLIREVSEKEEKHANVVLNFQSEIDDLRHRLVDEEALRVERDTSLAELGTAHERLDALTTAAQAADSLVEELNLALSAKQEELEVKEERVERLQGYVSKLLGIAAADVDTVTQIDSTVEPVSNENGDDSAKMRELQAANAVLEQGLVTANLRLAAYDGIALPRQLALNTAADNDDPTLCEANNDLVLSNSKEEVDLLSGLMSKTGVLREQLSVLEAKCSDTRHELSAALEREGQSIEALEGSMRSIEKLESEKIELASRLEELEHVVVEKQEEVEELKALVSVEQDARGAAETALNTAREEIFVKEQRVNVLESQVVDQHTELNRVTSELEAIGAQRQDLESKVNDATRELAACTVARDQAITDLEKTRIAAQQASTVGAQKINTALGKYQDTHSQLVAVLAENVHLAESVCELERQLGIQAAQLSAQEAAGTLMRQWTEGSYWNIIESSCLSSSSSADADVAELARNLQTATLQQLELHRQVETLKRFNLALEKKADRIQSAAEGLQKSLASLTSDNAVQNKDQNCFSSGIGIGGGAAAVQRLQAEADNAALLSTSSAAAVSKQASIEVVTSELEKAMQQISTLENEAMEVRSELSKAVGAQHGQAACFATLAGKAKAQEKHLRTELEELRKVVEESHSMRSACIRAVGLLKAAVLASNGNNSRLKAAASPAATGGNITSVDILAIAETSADLLQEQAATISKLQTSINASGGEASLVDTSQRAVIRCLSAQLAQQAVAGLEENPANTASVTAGVLPVFTAAEGGRPPKQPSTKTPSKQRTTYSGYLPVSPTTSICGSQELDGLCALLLSQLSAVRAAESALRAVLKSTDVGSSGTREGNQEDGGLRTVAVHALDDVGSELRSMEAMLRVLRSEITTFFSNHHHYHNSPSFGRGSGSATADASNYNSLHAVNYSNSSHHHHQQQQFSGELDPKTYELADKVAVLSRRVGVLTSAHEAAKEEAAHARQAATELSALLTSTQEAQAAESEAAATKEERLRRRLAAARSENKELLAVLDKVEREWREWEQGVGATLHAMQKKLKKSTSSSTIGGTAADGSSSGPAGLASLLDGLDGLLGDANEMSQRIVELEKRSTALAAAKEESSLQERKKELLEERWACFARCTTRLHAAVNAVRASAQEERENANHMTETKCARQAQHIQELQAALVEAQEESERLRIRFEAVKEAQEEQLRKQAELQVSQLAEVEATADQRTKEAAQKAADAAERRIRFELSSAVDDARYGVAEAQRAVAVLRAERDSILTEFQRYQDIKTAEVKLLENRLGIQNLSLNDLQDDNNNTNIQNTLASSDTVREARQLELERATAAGEIAAACRSDAVAAALREARLESSARRKLEEELKSHKEALRKAQNEGKAAEQELHKLKKAVKELTAEGHVRAVDQESTRQELAACRADVAHHQAEIRRLQAQLTRANRLQSMDQLQLQEKQRAAAEAADQVAGLAENVNALNRKLNAAERELTKL